MKKTLISLITTALLALQSGTAVLAHAEAVPTVDIRTDAFAYHSEEDYRDPEGQVYYKNWTQLTFADTKANYMVSGVYQDGYIVTWLEPYADQGKNDVLRGWMDLRDVEGADNLMVGDLFYAENDYGIEPNPFQHHARAGSFVYFGNGVGVLGDAFADVVRHELRLTMNMNRGLLGNELNWDAVPESVMKRGDVIDDGSLDIVDVVAVNKYVLGASSLDERAELSADVNRDLTVDATDSLMLLKEVIGLTTNFEET